MQNLVIFFPLFQSFYCRQPVMRFFLQVIKAGCYRLQNSVKAKYICMSNSHVLPIELLSSVVRSGFRHAIEGRCSRDCVSAHVREYDPVSSVEFRQSDLLHYTIQTITGWAPDTTGVLWLFCWGQLKDKKYQSRNGSTYIKHGHCLLIHGSSVFFAHIGRVAVVAVTMFYIHMCICLGWWQQNMINITPSMSLVNLY